MLIDCDTCMARGAGCGDCVITVLLGPIAARPPHQRGRPQSGLDLDDAARAAIGHLAEAGLVPPLRLVAPLDGPPDADGAPAGGGDDIAEIA